MLIQKFSKDAKRGVVVGSNSLTPEKIAAGAITLASALMVSAVGGLIPKPKKTSYAGSGRQKSHEKKKKGLLLLATPFVFKAVKSKLNMQTLAGAVERFSPDSTGSEDDDGSGIEVINATPIASEEEIYEHI